MTCLGVKDGGKVAGGSYVFSCVSINNESLMTKIEGVQRLSCEPLSNDSFYSTN